MATVIREERVADADRGLGAAGIIAILVVVLLAAFLLFRWVGVAPATGDGVNNGASVSGSVNVDGGNGAE
jgi:hypothetical protein